MRILLVLMTLTWLNTSLKACKNNKIFMQEATQCNEIKFNHIVYTTQPDNDGYSECNHLYVIDPTSKMNILHPSGIAMNDFTADTISVLPSPSNNFYFESNLSFCGEGAIKQTIYDTAEEVRFINNDIVSIDRNNYFYGAGAAHGHTNIQHYIYDRKHGMKLNWNDLFKDDNIEKYILNRVMNELASREYLDFIRKNKDDLFILAFHDIDPDSVLMNFKKDGYFSILKEGLLIQYNAYEIAPYASGSPSLIISPDLLKEHMHKKIYEMCFSDKNNVKIRKKCH